MKYLKIGFIILIILASVFVGYKGYLAYQKWQEPKIETIKTVVEVTPDITYEGLKEQVIELKEDEETNKEEIEILREALSVERKAFLNSDDTILIKTTGDDTILLYRDIEGNLQAGSDNISKIIEHRDVVILAEEELMIKETSYDLKAGAYYSFDKTYGVIVSKEIFSIKDCSLNASVLLNDFEDFKFNIGGDVGYEIKENLELGIGYSTNKDFYIKLQYEF